MNRTVLLAASLGLALVACRGSSSGDDVADVDATVAAAQTIMDVQSEAMAPATPVALKGVIVTAIDAFGAKMGDFWVQDPAGGAFSGVHVFGAPVDQVAGLTLGDVVDIAGAEKDEFALSSDLTGRTLTELKPVTGGMMTVSKTGTGAVPDPVVVDALAIGMLDGTAAHPNAQDMEWEKWEGVLITVTDVAQTGAVRDIGSGSTADPTFKKFGITGNAQVETSLAAFPASIADGTCYMAITGVGDYFFDYLIFPRTTDEIVAGGSDCPAPESTHALCSDSMDNDGNGFSDCADISCVIGDSVCRATTTISALQAGPLPATGVEISDVFVTGVSFNKKTIWVSSSLAASANNGITVFNGDPVEAGIVIGAKVNVIGKAVENNNDMMGETVTTINSYAIELVTAPAAPPVPVVGQTVATLMAAATGEPYESVLVTLTNVKVVTLGTSANFNVSDVAQKTTAVTAFKADDDIYRFVAADLADCYSSITGIWTYTVFDNAYLFLPRAKAGVTPAAPDGTLAANQADCN